MNDEEKSAVIWEVVGRLRDRGWIGKTHLQKAVLFLQDAAGIPLGFRYVIHHYGPYSFELDSFLRDLHFRGTLLVEREADGYGYSVSRGEIVPSVHCSEESQRKVEALAVGLGGQTAADLEILATCQYIRTRFGHLTFDAQISAVTALKPRFPQWQVKRAMEHASKLSAELAAA